MQNSEYTSKSGTGYNIVMMKRAKRVRAAQTRPNALLESWLIEWRDKAKEKDSPAYHTFVKVSTILSIVGTGTMSIFFVRKITLVINAHQVVLLLTFFSLCVSLFTYN